MSIEEQIETSVLEALKQWCSIDNLDTSEAILELSNGNHLTIAMSIMDVCEKLNLPYQVNEREVFTHYATAQDIIQHLVNINKGDTHD